MIPTTTISEEDVLFLTKEYSKEYLSSMLKQLYSILSSGISLKKSAWVLYDIEVTKSALQYLTNAETCKN